MERAEIRSFYWLGAFLLLAFATPFGVGYSAGNIYLDQQWAVDLVNVLLNGLMQGGVYAMYGVGLTLIFGVMRILNVAHGELVMLGAYATWTLFNLPEFLGLSFHLDPLLALLAVVPLAFALGSLIQKALLNPVVGAPELTPLLITFGVGIVTINAVILIYTTDYRTIPYFPGTVSLYGPFYVGANRLISFLVAIAISMGVFLFLKFSRLGKAVRATAQNAQVAQVCGVNIQRIYVFTYALAAALAAAGGTLVSIQFGFNPETGVQYTIVSFAIIMLGGRGNYLGAVIGAVLLALLQNLVSFMVPNGSAMVEIAAYAMIIATLLIRPQGLLGVKDI